MSQGTSGAIAGIFGKPYLDLEPFLDLSSLPELHEEICLGLTRVPLDYTGGSHRTLGIVPESQQDPRYADYGEVLRALSPAELSTFTALSDAATDEPPPTDPGIAYGEEREIPLSRRQMLWLKFRHGVYFPWQAYFELIPNRYWSEKSEPKHFTRVARAIFPKTVAFVERLPFASVGRCNIMGLEASHHGTVHRDGEREQPEPAHFITLCPAANKSLFLWDEPGKQKLPVASRAYWFNDNDYHGVEAAPFFRYSLRVDGRFQPEFLERVRQGASS
ncbi:MAG TPA: hypothetical protein VJV79_29620 [Polyangiaceae bacterium]|nr:hypothetical protein [Polyangiaceae bacterium]